VILIESIKNLADFGLQKGRHIFQIAVMELFPADFAISVDVYHPKLVFQIAQQLILDEVVGNVNHYGRLEVVHLAEFFYGT
jgi:hypothetical protein